MKFSQCVYFPCCFKVHSSFQIYHSHDNGITRNHGITMVDQADRMSGVSNWQIYHLTRDQEGKSEGQKYNIYNTLSRWMHTEHLISRSLKSLSEERLQHTKAAVTGVFSIRLQYVWISSPAFPSIFPRNSKNLEIYFNGIVCHARHTSSSQLLPSFPLIPTGTTKLPFGTSHVIIHPLPNYI